MKKVFAMIVACTMICLMLGISLAQAEGIEENALPISKYLIE